MPIYMAYTEMSRDLGAGKKDPGTREAAFGKHAPYTITTATRHAREGSSWMVRLKNCLAFGNL